MNKIKKSNIKSSLFNSNKKKKNLSESSYEKSEKSKENDSELSNSEINNNNIIKENNSLRPINYDINVLTNHEKYNFQYKPNNNLYLHSLTNESQTPSHSIDTPIKKLKIKKKKYDFII